MRAYFIGNDFPSAIVVIIFVFGKFDCIVSDDSAEVLNPNGYEIDPAVASADV